MEKRFFHFCRTSLRETAPYCLTFFAINFAATDRTPRRHFEWNTIRRALDDTDDLRYDITAALEQNAVVYLHAKPPDLVFIMSGRISNCGSAQLHGLELGNRRQRTC